MGVKRMPEDRKHLCSQLCRPREGCHERTLKTNPVAPQTLHSLLEENLALGGHAGNVVLLPLNGGVNVLEDLLDGVGNLVTNTISGDEGNLDKTRG